MMRLYQHYTCPTCKGLGRRAPDLCVPCSTCGGWGDLTQNRNDDLERRAVDAWRKNNSLVSRLIDLHQRNPELAQRLAYYVETYYIGRTEAGQRWPYQWLMADVSHWPQQNNTQNEAP